MISFAGGYKNVFRASDGWCHVQVVGEVETAAAPGEALEVREVIRVVD